MSNKTILLTGATGYVGGRLLPLLVADGWHVRCLARQPKRLLSRVPTGIEVVSGDILDYLRTALLVDTQNEHLAFEIGGPNQVSYGELMHEYARQRRLRRWMIPLPFLTPLLSSLWLGLHQLLFAGMLRGIANAAKSGEPRL